MKTHTLSTVLFMISLLICSTFIISSGSADTLTVDDDSGADFTSIQDAIHAANESDTIQVAPGTYNENIEINKTIILTGSGKSSTSIIGTDTSKNTIKITANHVTITGFSIDNSAGQSNHYNCIFLQNAEYCTLDDNIIEQGENGIYLITSTQNDIENNIIQQNNQKGIRLSSSSNNNIYENTVQDNGDGVYLTNSHSNEIHRNIILNNGFGVYLTQGSDNNMVYLNDFDDNSGGNAADTEANQWSKNNQGNYWDDYNDYDSNSDGIGDTPYEIDQDSHDNYPLGNFLTSNQKPIAVIDSISPHPATVGDSVTFHGHGTDDGTIIAWEWTSSKQGVFGTSADCTYTSFTSGTHTISFRVKDDQDQWSDYDTTTLDVQTDTPEPSNQQPTAVISLIEPTKITKGEEITFNGYGSDSDGEIVSYQWSSSIDGQLSTQSSFSDTTLSVGSHSISFKVQDDDGLWSSEETTTITVQEQDTSTTNAKPVVIPYCPKKQKVNTSVLFDASMSYDPDGSIISYEWDFGDNTTGTGKFISHSYNKIGNYTIVLTITDNEQGITSNTTTISIISSSQETPDDTTSQDEGQDTPSFELVTVILSLIILLSIMKKAKPS